ncbi:MAG: hypothetical protein Kow0027_11050 [Saprospiraceae bacterium]
MKKLQLTNRWLLLSLIIVLVAAFRLLPYLFGFNFLFNFSPIGAMALFGAAYFSRRQMAFAVPFAALWVSNIIIDNVFLSQYYEGFSLFSNWPVYLAFGLIVLLGMAIFKKVTPLRALAGSLSASVIFFIVSNFFVWMEGTMYPMSAEGLMACYVAAIPFFWNTLAGDLFFVAMMFGAFEAIQYRYPALRMQVA